jgi:hypothetical protein
MNQSPKAYCRQRAPRVKLSGSILVLLGMANRQHVRGQLHQLSINGGLLQLTEPLDQAVPVEIIFHLGSTTVRARAATLMPIGATQGCLQPFRFTEMPENDRYKLATDLQRLVVGTLSVAEQPPDDEKIMQSAPVEQPSKVVVYFNRPEDAFRFTAAVSSVMSAESRSILKEDFVRLAQAIGNVSRVTTKGIFKGESRQAESLNVAS